MGLGNRTRRLPALLLALGLLVGTTGHQVGRAEPPGRDTPARYTYLPDRAPAFVKFYYGTLDRVNHIRGVDPGFDVLSHFDILVTRPAGELSATEQAVVDRLRAAGKQVFGYVHLAQTLAPLTDEQIEAIMNQCAAAGYTGMFFDTAGYDYQVSRQRLNQHTAYAHAKGLQVIANAWHPEDVLSSQERDLNPTGEATTLGVGDWILLESFYHRSDDHYADEFGGTARTVATYQSAVALAAAHQVKVMGLTYHPTAKPLTDASDQARSYDLALLLGLNGWAYGTSVLHSDSVPWTDFAGYSAGSGYLSDLRQVSSNPLRLERWTNRGLIWVSATGMPVVRQTGVEIFWDRLPGGRLYREMPPKEGVEPWRPFSSSMGSSASRWPSRASLAWPDTAS